MVSAKPTSAANNPKSISFLWHSENDASDPPAEPRIPDVKVTHGHAAWNLNPDFSNYVQIGADDPIPIDAVAGYEGELYVQTVAFSPTVMALNYRVYEKIMWNGNYIEITCLERVSLELLPDPPYFSFYASGTFNGHGVIDGQKVQVTGIREGFTDAIIGFVLECSGTIRFAGNA